MKNSKLFFYLLYSYVLVGGLCLVMQRELPLLERLFIAIGLLWFIVLQQLSKSLPRASLLVPWALVLAKVVYPNDSLGGTLLALMAVALIEHLWVVAVTAIYLAVYPSVCGITTLLFGLCYFHLTKKMKILASIVGGLICVVYMKLTPNFDSSRIVTLKQILPSWDGSFWWGTGVNSFFPRTLEKQSEVFANGYYFAHAHSDAIEFFLTLGAMGCLLLLASLVARFREKNKARQALMVAFIPTLCFNLAIHTALGVFLFCLLFKEDMND